MSHDITTSMLNNIICTHSISSSFYPNDVWFSVHSRVGAPL
jgi:hypothetical protein